MWSGTGRSHIEPCRSWPRHAPRDMTSLPLAIGASRPRPPAAGAPLPPGCLSPPRLGQPMGVHSHNKRAVALAPALADGGEGCILGAEGGGGGGGERVMAPPPRLKLPQEGGNEAEDGRLTGSSTAEDARASWFVCGFCQGSGSRAGKPSKRHKQLLHKRKVWEQKVAGGLIDVSAAGPRPEVPAVDPDQQQVPCRRCSGVGLLRDPPCCTSGSGGGQRRSRAEAAAAEAEARGDPLVAVVGGGVGGAALAVALQQRGMRVVVYERDESFNARAQGYGLTMQQGGAALQQLGIKYEGVSSTAHFSFTADREILGSYGRRLRDETELCSTPPESPSPPSCKKSKKKSPRGNTHIPRQELRMLLYRELLPGTVKWGHRLSRYVEMHGDEDGDTSSGGGRVRLEFETGQPPVECDVLVGGDGIFSAVRRQKLGEGRDTLRYLGVMVMLGIAPCEYPGYDATVCQTLDGDTRMYTMPFTAAGAAERVAGSGTALPGAASRRLSQQGDCDDEGDDSDDEARSSSEEGSSMSPATSMWQLSFPFPEEQAAAMSGKPALLKAEALRRCGSWHAPIPELLEATGFECVTGYPVYDRPLLEPERCRGSPNSRVTLLGDAAHPMSPFKGQGANQALLDAVSLARALYLSELGAPAAQANREHDSRQEGKQGSSEASFTASPDAGVSQQQQEQPQPEGDDSSATEGAAKDVHAEGRRCRTRQSTAEALAAYEAEMLRRSAVMVEKSAENARILHNPVALSLTLDGKTRAAVAREELGKKSQSPPQTPATTPVPRSSASIAA